VQKKSQKSPDKDGTGKIPKTRTAMDDREEVTPRLKGKRCQKMFNHLNWWNTKFFGGKKWRRET